MRRTVPAKPRLFLALPPLLVCVAVTGATTITVDQGDSTVDPMDGRCSLREAIVAANTDAPSGAGPGECPAGSGADTITLSGAVVDWQAENGFDTWNVYRGDLQLVVDACAYVQLPGIEPAGDEVYGLTAPFLQDTDPIPEGAVAFYLITGESPAGESGLGTDETGRERPRTGGCAEIRHGELP